MIFIVSLPNSSRPTVGFEVAVTVTRCQPAQRTPPKQGLVTHLSPSYSGRTGMCRVLAKTSKAVVGSCRAFASGNVTR